MIASSSVWGNKWSSIYCGMSLPTPCCQGAPDIIRSYIHFWKELSGHSHILTVSSGLLIYKTLCFWRVFIHFLWATFPQKDTKLSSPLHELCLLLSSLCSPCQAMVCSGCFMRTVVCRKAQISCVCKHSNAKFQPFSFSCLLHYS